MVEGKGSIALLTCRPGDSLLQACAVHSRVFSGAPAFYSLHAPHPLSFDKPKCFQTPPHVPWGGGGVATQAENHRWQTLGVRAKVWSNHFTLTHYPNPFGNSLLFLFSRQRVDYLSFSLHAWGILKPGMLSDDQKHLRSELQQQG